MPVRTNEAASAPGEFAARANRGGFSSTLSTETLRLAASGDQVAVEAFVHRYRDELVSFARKRQSTEPEEIAFRALEQGLNRLPDMASLNDRSVRAYLYQIVRGGLSDEHRLRAKRPTAMLVEEDLEARLLEPSPEDSVVNRDILTSLLEQLSTRDRDIVTRRYLLEEGYPQIAVDLGVDEATVRKAKSRAVGRLKKIAAAAGLLALAVGVLSVINDGNRTQPVDTTPATDNTITNQEDEQSLQRRDISVDLQLADPELAESESADLGIGPVPDSEVDRRADETLIPPDLPADETLLPSDGPAAEQPEIIEFDDAPFKPASVFLFQDWNYAGATWRLNLGDVASTPADWEGQVSGLIVYPSVQLRACTDPNGQQGCTVFRGSMPRLDSPLNDSLAYFEVIPMPGVFSLAFDHSGKCMTVTDDGPVGQANVEQQTCDGSDGQQFEAVQLRNDAMALRSIDGARCLEIVELSADNTELQHQPCNGGQQNQQFRWRGTSLTTGDQARCLTVPDGGLANGDRIQLLPCIQVAQQRLTVRA